VTFRRQLAAVALLLSCAAPGVMAAPALSATAGPPMSTADRALSFGPGHQGVDPSGANDWDCKPSEAHPRPVVLLHGTFSNKFRSWAGLSPKLKAAGYCVFAPDYGIAPAGVGALPGVFGLAPMRTSSKQVAAFVDRVLEATGAEQVDLVGYSQGGPLARAYLKYDGGAAISDPTPAKDGEPLNKVHSVVSLGATNHGTTVAGFANLATRIGLLAPIERVLGDAAADQVRGSPFMTQLNAGSETQPGVNYTNIATKYDLVSYPYRGAFLTAGPGATVQNITLQDGCRIDFVDHVGLPYDERVQALVLHALDPKSEVPVVCRLQLTGL
jgi:triacylglycerol esterase/lipase EstA (alpha/beta hydrolase family)